MCVVGGGVLEDTMLVGLQIANYVVRTEDAPRAIPGRTIVYCLKQWPGAYLPRALYKVIGLGRTAHRKHCFPNFHVYCGTAFWPSVAQNNTISVVYHSPG